MTTSIEAPIASLYVGTYAKYNNGSIKGAWLKLEDHSDAEAFMDACRELHKDESDPELMFQDFECFPKELYSESMSLEDIEKLYVYFHMDEDEKEMLSAYLDCTGGKFDEDTLSEAQEAFSGKHDSDEDFAQDIAEQTEATDTEAKWPYTCIDWTHAASELMYDYHEANGFYFRA